MCFHFSSVFYRYFLQGLIFYTVEDCHILCWFFPQHFVLFVATANGIVSLNYISICLPLQYRKGVDVEVLIMYIFIFWTYLSVLRVCFLLESLVYKVLSSENWDLFTSMFLFLPSAFFSCHIALRLQLLY